jgi:hypothetical protein
MIGFGVSVGIGNRIRRIESETEGRLEYIQGGGIVLPLFESPFFGVGLFSIWALFFRGIPKLFQVPIGLADVPGIRLGFGMTIAVGGTFGAVGAWCIFSRTGVILKGSTDTVTVVTTGSRRKIERVADEVAAFLGLGRTGKSTTNTLVSQ